MAIVAKIDVINEDMSIMYFEEESNMKYECRNSLTKNVSRTFDTYEEAHEHAYRFDEEIWEVSEEGEKRIY